MHARRGSLHIFWLSLIESSGPSHDDVWSRSKNGVLHTYWNSPFHRQLLFNQLYLHKTGHYQFIPANPAFNSNHVRCNQLAGIHYQEDMEKDWLGQITVGPNSRVSQPESDTKASARWLQSQPNTIQQRPQPDLLQRLGEPITKRFPQGNPWTGLSNKDRI